MNTLEDDIKFQNMHNGFEEDKFTIARNKVKTFIISVLILLSIIILIGVLL